MSRLPFFTIPLFLVAIGVTLQAAEPMTTSDSTHAWKKLPLISNGEVAPEWKHTGYGTFAVVDGTLRTDNDARGLGLLYYQAEKFGNCQIRVIYRPENPRSNSGVYVRIADGLPDAPALDPVERQADGSLSPEQTEVMKNASEKEQGPWYAVHHGFEIQICDAANPAHRTGSIYSLTTAAEFPKSEDEWNEMIITLDDTRITTAINGKQVATWDSKSDEMPPRNLWYEPKREPTRPTKGYLGLQNHDPDDVVFFKEISVRPLGVTQSE